MPITLFFVTKDKEDTQEVQLLDLVLRSVPHENSSGDFNLENVERSLDFPSIQLDILQAATNNFCDENKLGQGGSGLVYKGTLLNGKEIAVKRLSITSDQGLLEFKNEVILIAKLQHRNLVRLLGCCSEKNEMLLVYEFMPNRSLDVFGYMAPEYAMEGLFSIKYDIFSFRVILLEIINGKRNNGFQLLEHGESLLTFVCFLILSIFSEGMELIDEHLVESSVPAESGVLDLKWELNCDHCSHIDTAVAREPTKAADEPLGFPTGSITRARGKRFKERVLALIYGIWCNIVAGQLENIEPSNPCNLLQAQLAQI
ncbi:hypothetical protein Gotur_018827 [Gossypium turneri]